MKQIIDFQLGMPIGLCRKQSLLLHINTYYKRIASFSVAFALILSGLSFGQEKLVPVEPVEDALTPFEKAELRRLLNLDVRTLARQPIQGVLGYEQEYWRNPASVHVIRPEDITLNGHLTTVEALRGVPGMHVSRGLAYDNFVTMRNFSGFTTEKFFALIDGRESSQLMLGSANWTVDDYPVAVVDRVEIIRGPGASIWGTNAVNGVVNAVTKHASATQGDSVRLVIQDDGSFLGDYIHGGQVSEDSYYRVWVRDQEYAEGTLNSGLPARDDGYLRKAGFRYDKELGSDLNLLVSGGYATRRLEHVVDLSNRLFYLDLSVPLDIQSPALISLDKARKDFPDSFLTPFGPPAYPGNWALYLNPDSYALPSDFNRYEYYGEMSNDSAHIQARLDGVTPGDLEWSLTGYVDYSDIFLGHIGYRWEQREYDLAFRASRPVGDRNHLAFGLSGRRVSLDVESTVTAPWKFPAVKNPYDPAFIRDPFDPVLFFDPSRFSDEIPILDYDQSANRFDRANAYIQDTIELGERTLFSIGSKFEENDLSGFGVQPGARFSWLANASNVFWGAYSKTHRQPSLRERYTALSDARIWVPLSPDYWVNRRFEGDASLDKEEMDAYEVGWRSRPRQDLILELSLYYYDTKDAVLANPKGQNWYEAQDAESYGGEISVDYRPADVWLLKGGFSVTKGKVEGVEKHDFPQLLANLSSHLRLSDAVLFSQNLYYSGPTEIPSDYNPITIPSHLRLDLGLIWQPADEWEVGLFGRDLLEPYHVETMFPLVDVEPARVKRTFILSITKQF